MGTKFITGFGRVARKVVDQTPPHLWHMIIENACGFSGITFFKSQRFGSKRVFADVSVWDASYILYATNKHPMPTHILQISFESENLETNAGLAPVDPFC